MKGYTSAHFSRSMFMGNRAENQGGKLRARTTEELSSLAGSIDNTPSDFFLIIHIYLPNNDPNHPQLAFPHQSSIKRISHVIWQRASLTEANLQLSCSLP